MEEPLLIDACVDIGERAAAEALLLIADLDIEAPDTGEFSACFLKNDELDDDEMAPTRADADATAVSLRCLAAFVAARVRGPRRWEFSPKSSALLFLVSGEGGPSSSCMRVMVHHN